MCDGDKPSTGLTEWCCSSDSDDDDSYGGERASALSVRLPSSIDMLDSPEALRSDAIEREEEYEDERERHAPTLPSHPPPPPPAAPPARQGVTAASTAELSPSQQPPLMGRGKKKQMAEKK